MKNPSLACHLLGGAERAALPIGCNRLPFRQSESSRDAANGEFLGQRFPLRDATEIASTTDPLLAFAGR